MAHAFSWIKRNRKRIATAALSAILALFGSIKDTIEFFLGLLPAPISPNSQVLQGLFLGASLLVAFFLGRSLRRPKQGQVEQPGSNAIRLPSLESALARQEHLQDVTNSLRVHH